MGSILTKTNNSGYPEKYKLLRNEIKNGDLILYRGSSILAKGIQYFDKAYYNHIGVVWKPEECSRLLTLDMWQEGLTCIPLSRRMDGYKDFCILRPKVSSEIIKSSLDSSLSEWDGSEIKYDSQLILRVAVIKKLRLDLTGLGKKEKFICSEYIQHYCNLLGLETYSNINLITPEDFRRFIDDNFELLYDDSTTPDMSYYKKNSEVKCLFGKNYKLQDK